VHANKREASHETAQPQLDISVSLDNDTILDPPFMRPKIDYKTGR
jgi:hypothetical protein